MLDAYVIDEIKRSVPIWKREHFEGGIVWIEGQGGRSWRSYMDTSRVASEFLKFWLGGYDCGLTSGLLVQSGRAGRWP